MMRKKGTVPRVCEHCGARFVVWPSKAAAGHGRFCSPGCRYRGLKRKWGADHAQWRGGRVVGVNGYVYVRVAPNTLVLEHRAVWERAYGPIPDGMVIHHRNRNRSDNRLENLEAVDETEHLSQHFSLAGRWSKRHNACVLCGTAARPHHAHGLCSRCLERVKRETHHFRRLTARPAR